MSVERARKGESASDVHSMIDDTLSMIDKSWMPGALEWMKKTRPKEFEKMIAVEREINRFALGKDVNGMNEALKNYKELMFSVVKAFKVPKGETENLFQHG